MCTAYQLPGSKYLLVFVLSVLSINCVVNGMTFSMYRSCSWLNMSLFFVVVVLLCLPTFELSKHEKERPFYKILFQNGI